MRVGHVVTRQVLGLAGLFGLWTSLRRRFGVAAVLPLLLGALALLPLRWPDALGLALVAGSTVWLRQGLMPRINALSDAAQAGDAAAKAGFARAHQLSVLVNVAQMLVALAVLLRFA